ncbi:MAG: hypothetical protein ACT4OE_08885 [Sphingosinicella sp.]
MKLAVLVAAVAASASSAAPSVAQFNSAMAAACPAPPAQTRNVRCARPDPRSIQYSCSYEMRGADGRWASHAATLQVAEGEWVWIDGPTLCDDEDASLN